MGAYAGGELMVSHGFLKKLGDILVDTNPNGLGIPQGIFERYTLYPDEVLRLYVVDEVFDAFKAKYGIVDSTLSDGEVSEGAVQVFNKIVSGMLTQICGQIGLSVDELSCRVAWVGHIEGTLFCESYPI